MRYYIMQYGTTVTGRRGWMVLFEAASKEAAELYLAQNDEIGELKIEAL